MTRGNMQKRNADIRKSANAQRARGQSNQDKEVARLKNQRDSANAERDAAQRKIATMWRGRPQQQKPQAKSKAKPTASHARGIGPGRPGGVASPMDAYKFYDPAFNLYAMPSLMSVARFTHAPTVARFSMVLPANVPAVGTGVEKRYKKMLIMTPTPSATACMEWTLEGDAAGWHTTTYKFHYFTNLLPSTALEPDIPSGGNDIPENSKVSRFSLHIQNTTNMFKKTGDVYVRRLAAGVSLLADAPGSTSGWFVPQDFENINDSVLADFHTASYIGADFTNLLGIAAIPNEQGKYTNFAKWDGGPYTYDATTTPPIHGFKSFQQYLADPAMSTIILLFDGVEDPQQYKVGIFADNQMRFPSGSLLNNQANSGPTSSAANLNKMRDGAEATGSRLANLSSARLASSRQAAHTLSVIG